MKLCKLRPEVIVKLRSGIVITSVVHCVNELVANSIDAGANCIAVRLNLPYCKIQVIDNGDGIPFDQMDLIGERYATSKCFSLEDLGNLRCGGFRGESLASLKDISNIMVIETHHRLSKGTFSKIFKQGKAAQSKRSATDRATHGTTVTIHDFMYNMPVRKQGISEALDLEECRRSLEKIALMHPHISFSLRTDATGEICLETKKCNSLLMAFTFIYGRDKSQHLREISLSDGKLNVSGMISTEGHMSKDLQLFYVNKRPISRCKFHKLVNSMLNKVLFTRQKAIGKDISYLKTKHDSPSKHQNHYAIFVLNISCPYSEIDVTFDPKKSAVVFAEESKVISLIERAVLKFFESNNLMSMPQLNEQHKKSTETCCVPDETKQFPRDIGREINIADLNEVLISLPAKRPFKPPNNVPTSKLPVSNANNNNVKQSSSEHFMMKKGIDKQVRTSVITSSVITVTNVLASGQKRKFAHEMDKLLTMCTKKEVDVPKRSVFTNPNPVMMLAPIKYPSNDLKGGTPAVKFITRLRERYQFKKGKTLRKKCNMRHCSIEPKPESLHLNVDNTKVSRFSFRNTLHFDHLKRDGKCKHAKHFSERNRKNLIEKIVSSTNEICDDPTRISCCESNANFASVNASLKEKFEKPKSHCKRKAKRAEKIHHLNSHEKEEKLNFQNDNALQFFKFSPKKYAEISESQNSPHEDFATTTFNKSFATDNQYYKRNFGVVSPFFAIDPDIPESCSFQKHLERSTIEGNKKLNPLKRTAAASQIFLEGPSQSNNVKNYNDMKQMRCSFLTNIPRSHYDTPKNVNEGNGLEEKRLLSTDCSSSSSVVSKRRKSIILSSDEDSPSCPHETAQLQDLHPVFQSMVKNHTGHSNVHPQHPSTSEDEENSIDDIMLNQQSKDIIEHDMPRIMKNSSLVRNEENLKTDVYVQESNEETTQHNTVNQVGTEGMVVKLQNDGEISFHSKPEDKNCDFSKTKDIVLTYDDNPLCSNNDQKKEQDVGRHVDSEVGIHKDLSEEQTISSNDFQKQVKEPFGLSHVDDGPSKPQSAEHNDAMLPNQGLIEESVQKDDKVLNETEDATGSRYLIQVEPGTERTIFIDRVTGNSSYECVSVPNELPLNELCTVSARQSHFFLTHDAAPFVARPWSERSGPINTVGQGAVVSFDPLTLDALQDHNVTVKWNVPLPNMQDSKVENLFSSWDNPMFKCASEDKNLAMTSCQNPKNGYSILNMHQFTKRMFSKIQCIVLLAGCWASG